MIEAGIYLFFLQDVDGTTAYVRKEDLSQNVKFDKYLSVATTKDMAIPSTGSQVYVRLYHSGEGVTYMAELDGTNGALLSAIKG
jgi:hypothetical protein